MLAADRGGAARSGGRPLVHDGRLFRWGQDCSATYGNALAAYQVVRLSPTEFQQERTALNVSGLPSRPPKKVAWNSARHHHLDLLQLGPGEWVAAMDGDKVPSGPISSRLLRVAWLVAAPWAVLVAAVSATSLWARHRSALRRWVLRSGCAASRVWPLGMLARPLVVLAVRSSSVAKRARKAKSSALVLSSDGGNTAGDQASPPSDLEEGDSPPAAPALSPAEPLRHSSSLDKLVSPVGGTQGGAMTMALGSVLSPRHYGSGNSGGLARLSPAFHYNASQGQGHHGQGTPSPLLPRARGGGGVLRGLMAAHGGSASRRNWRRCSVLGLPLRAVVLGSLALASLCTASEPAQLGPACAAPLTRKCSICAAAARCRRPARFPNLLFATHLQSVCTATRRPSSRRRALTLLTARYRNSRCWCGGSSGGHAVAAAIASLFAVI